MIRDILLVLVAVTITFAYALMWQPQEICHEPSFGSVRVSDYKEA
jgi:hypothetical protein